MSQLVSLLVGEHFRPPAKLVLQHLPSGTPLQLELEDDNPYDAEAVRVYVETRAIPESQWEGLAQELPNFGLTLEQVMSGGNVWLGYIPASGGKPLAQARKLEPGLVGNHEFREGMIGGGWSAYLEFAPDGKPRISLIDGESA